jgi:predicted flap endonuclease-1-like 5' DNA nuclease
MEPQNELLSSKKRKRKRKRQRPASQITDQVRSGYPNQTTEQLAADLANRDDLLLIEGIGPALEMALNSIGIRKYADFENLTPESLSKTLEERTGLTISAAELENENWIGQAKRLARENSVPILETEFPGQDLLQTDSESIGTASDEIVEPEPANMDVPKPENLSASATEIENRHGEEPDENSSAFAASPPEQSFLGESPKRAPYRRQDMPGPGKLEPVDKNPALRIESVRFTSIEIPEADDAPPQKLLRGEIHYGLAEDKALAQTILQAPLCAQIHAIDLDTGEHTLLAFKADRLQPDQMDYELQLDFALPGEGRYRLQVVVFRLDSNPDIEFYQGPILRVEP